MECLYLPTIILFYERLKVCLLFFYPVVAVVKFIYEAAQGHLHCFACLLKKLSCPAQQWACGCAPLKPVARSCTSLFLLSIFQKFFFYSALKNLGLFSVKIYFKFSGWETILLCEVIFERLVKFNNL